jgi:lysophospholipase L1-like esterase
VGVAVALSLAHVSCGGSPASSGASAGNGSSGPDSGATGSSSGTGSGVGNGTGSSTGAGDTTASGSSSGGDNSASAPSGAAGGPPAGNSGVSTTSSGAGDGGSGSAQTGATGSSSGSAGGGDAGTSGAVTQSDASTGGGDAGNVDQSKLPPVTLHMAGDSTMSNYTTATTQEGWGQELGQFFISQVTIDNQAQPGANIQTFYGGKWKTLIANVKAGDYVMAAFGINDSGTTHGPVSVPDFTTELGVMAGEVAAKNATFIPTTSSPLQVWVNAMETNTRLQPYVDATIAFGMTKSLLVDNLNAAGVAYYNMIGQTAAAALTFNGDKAHFDKAGATAMAMLASKQLATIGSPLAKYLK